MTTLTLMRCVCADLGGHAMAGVQDGFVIVLGALVQTVAAGLAVPHLYDNTGREQSEEET